MECSLLFKLLMDVCILKDTKLLITEDNTFVAAMIEVACNYFHVECEVMHSGLTSAERVKLSKRFRNDREKLLLRFSLSCTMFRHWE